jgi:AbrB family looped-hinge helix DNA binding protein
MPYSRITSKGQVTVPKAVRDALGVVPGDRIAFRIEDDGRVLVEPETVDLLALRAFLKPRRRGITVDDMETAVRNGAALRSQV